MSRKAFTLIELMIVVAIIGILAAVAIPTFLKYIKKAKTSEASFSLKAMGDGASAYYDVEDYTTTGDPVPRQFPDSTGPMPTAGPCSTGVPQYKADPSIWETPTWKALKFGVVKPHFFQYQFYSAGTATTSVFTAFAWANLDCDGTTSEYKTMGTVDVASGEVRRTNVVITNELE